MKAGIITIGDELLLGQTINTNLAKIGKELADVGVDVLKSTTIKDNEQDIVDTLDELLKKVDLIIITGGLGPTNDDITKETLTKYFKTELVLNETVLTHVRQIFESKGKKMLAINVGQAMLPKDALILENPLGTAPGMWFEQNGKVVISLPGVPYELIGLIDNQVIPRLKEGFNLNGKYYQTVMIQGIGESYLAEIIKDWESRIYEDNMGLAYLPTPGMIRLRITSDNGKEDAPKIEEYIKEIEDKLPQYVYGRNDISIYESVAELMKSKGLTLGTVESCTGGGIANAFVEYPGASDFLKGGLITYSNVLKEQLANVSSQTLSTYGAVSEEVVKEMAVGGRKVLDVDYSIAVSGIAGPEGGTSDKPVGTVWIAVASPDKAWAKKFLFGQNRGRNIEMTKMTAANMLRLALLEIFDSTL